MASISAWAVGSLQRARRGCRPRRRRAPSQHDGGADRHLAARAAAARASSKAAPIGSVGACPGRRSIVLASPPLSAIRPRMTDSNDDDRGRPRGASGPRPHPGEPAAIARSASRAGDAAVPRPASAATASRAPRRARAASDAVPQAARRGVRRRPRQRRQTPRRFRAGRAPPTRPAVPRPRRGRARPYPSRPARRSGLAERPSREEPPGAAAPSEPAEERIAKVIARAGIASRRDAEAMIAEGRVTLNGEVLTSPAVNVTAPATASPSTASRCPRRSARACGSSTSRAAS